MSYTKCWSSHCHLSSKLSQAQASNDPQPVSEVALEVQKWILPRWGFDPSIHGAQEAETAIAAVPWSQGPKVASYGNLWNVTAFHHQKWEGGMWHTMARGHLDFGAWYMQPDIAYLRRSGAPQMRTLPPCNVFPRESPGPAWKSGGNGRALRGCCGVLGNGVVTTCLFHMIFFWSVTSVSGQWNYIPWD